MAGSPASKKETVVCIGCGKPIEDGDKAYRITSGHVEDEGFEESAVFGDLHKSCFNRAVESPKLILEEVRQMARPSRPRSTKRASS